MHRSSPSGLLHVTRFVALHSAISTWRSSNTHAFGEKFDAEFRAEVFDVTNTPAFAQPNGSFGSTSFGTITATVTDPRVVQFALKLTR